MRQTTSQPPVPGAPKTAAAVPPLSIAFLARQGVQPTLGVKRRTWRMDDDHAHLADAAFADTRQQVLNRDNFTCRFCGFKATKYQEVHHLDDNHQNNDQTNLLTVCNLCHMVHHLGLCGMKGAGFIAAIPELTQVEVNQIARNYFVAAMIGDQNTKDRLTGLYALFRARADGMKVVFGDDLSDPLRYAQALSALDDKAYASAVSSCSGLIRVVPKKEAFHPGQLEFYCANLRPQFSTDSWSALASQLMKA